MTSIRRTIAIRNRLKCDSDSMGMQNFYHKYDLPNDVVLDSSVAIDCEAMGLAISRDRLCVVQIADVMGNVHVVHFPKPEYSAPNLKKFLSDEKILKIFHFARFDLSAIYHYLGVEMKNIYCTKLASRLVRTYTDSHSLRELCAELLGIKISKQQQCSDWGSDDLTEPQIEYAASDVVHLHALRLKLNQMLIRENRMAIVQRCFDFLPARAVLDTIGWDNVDIFAHH